MGKRSAVVELFLGDMGSIQRELRPSTQREDQLTMETKLEQIAVKAVNQLPKKKRPFAFQSWAAGAARCRKKKDRLAAVSPNVEMR
jgi:hypothetical protein